MLSTKATNELIYVANPSCTNDKRTWVLTPAHAIAFIKAYPCSRGREVRDSMIRIINKYRSGSKDNVTTYPISWRDAEEDHHFVDPAPSKALKTDWSGAGDAWGGAEGMDAAGGAADGGAGAAAGAGEATDGAAEAGEAADGAAGAGEAAGGAAGAGEAAGGAAGAGEAAGGAAGGAAGAGAGGGWGPGVMAWGAAWGGAGAGAGAWSGSSDGSSDESSDEEGSPAIPPDFIAKYISKGSFCLTPDGALADAAEVLSLVCEKKEPRHAKQVTTHLLDFWRKATDSCFDRPSTA